MLVLITLVAGLLVWQRPWQRSDEPVAAIPANAAAVLAQRFGSLSTAESEKQFVEAAGSLPAARSFARRTWRSLKALDARELDLRYVSGGESADRADGSATASVEVTWRPGSRSGLQDTVRHTDTIEFRVVPDGSGSVSIVSASAKDAALPVWLVGAVTVERAGGITVIRVDGGDPQLPVDQMTTTARTAVTRLLPQAERQITVVSPRTQRQAAQILGRSSRDVEQIAAVTTTLDANRDASAGTVIICNPLVFATMERRAAQIVLTHEATHLLTAAIGSGAPSWVVEGFADFVALHDDTAPLSVSAGQILREVKAGALPDRLPTAAEFDSGHHGLGAVYESAWLVFRMLADRYGDDRVVGFYDAVVGGSEADIALESSFGLDLDRLTARWRDYLSKRASTVS